jgi:hypothetical protein
LFLITAFCFKNRIFSLMSKDFMPNHFQLDIYDVFSNN